MQTTLTSLAAELVTELQQPAPWVLCVMLPLPYMLLNAACLAGQCRPTSWCVVCRASRRAPVPRPHTLCAACPSVSTSCSAKVIGAICQSPARNCANFRSLRQLQTPRWAACLMSLTASSDAGHPCTLPVPGSSSSCRLQAVLTASTSGRPLCLTLACLMLPSASCANSNGITET